MRPRSGLPGQARQRQRILKRLRAQTGRRCPQAMTTCRCRLRLALRTEPRGDERRQLVVDELLHLRRLEDLDERPQPRIVLLVLARGEAQHQGVVDGAVDQERRFRVAAGRDQIGDVDQREGDVVEGTVGLGRIQLNDLQVFRVLDDIELAHREALAGRQLDQAGPLQQDQAAGAVQRLVRDGDGIPRLDVLQPLDLLGEQSDRRDHADLVDLDQVEAALLVLNGEISAVLKQVGIDIPAENRLVDRHPIGEFDDLDVDPLLLGEIGRERHQLPDRPGAGGDLERLGGGSRGCQREKQACRARDLHKCRHRPGPSLLKS